MIEVTGLCKGYQGQGNYVVSDVNLHVSKGTIHGLIGHNGSGKTTIIKCLTGIYPADAGEVRIHGEKIFENPAVKEKVGYVADSNQMFGGYRISQLARLYAKLFSAFSMEEFDSLNRVFQVDMKKKIGQLSKGQQMRVSFMLNMARKPEVMILDEPTSGLDAMAKRDLLDILVSAVENEEMTVLISSHHLSELERICDSVTMLHQGRVQVQDELDKVRRKVVKYQVVFPGGAPEELYQRKDIYHISNMGSVYTVVLPEASEDFAGAMKSAGAVLVETMPVGLEESFVYMNRARKGGDFSE
ncbi:MAG: ABC transporter ATP-binding protein [Lachnospiraceae bacterium]|nr:ABC transporter ATP-binding protein [Lachnospiraceae bacterium]